MSGAEFVVAAPSSSVPNNNIFEEGHTLNVSGSEHHISQGKNSTQNNFRDNARQIEAEIYCENLTVNQNSDSTNLEPMIKYLNINITVPLQMQSPRNPHFTGREENLSIIHDHFCRSRSKDTPYIFALTGTGGMGKTQIALEYAYRYHNEYTAVFWLSAASEETLQQSFVEIMQRIIKEQLNITAWPHSTPEYNVVALKLGIPGLIDDKGNLSGERETIRAIKEAVFRWLKLPDSKWLLIFDNADDLETFDLQGYLPNHGSGAVLVTSRRPEFFSATQQMDLDGLNETDAIRLLLRLAQLTDYPEALEEDAASLVEKLGFMPLAISHAGCYMHETKSSIRDYLSVYDSAFLTVQSRTPRFGWSYHDTAATTWEISFSNVEKKDKKAASLLLTCSYFDPEEIFESLWEYEQSDKALRVQDKLSEARGLCQSVKDRILLLASYSLVRVVSFGVFSIHPVVHSWARERSKGFDRLRIMKDAIRTISWVFRFGSKPQLAAKWFSQDQKRLAPHLRYLDRHVSPKLSEVLLHENESGSELVDFLLAVHVVAKVFFALDRYNEAMLWYAQVLISSKRLFGADHPDTLLTLEGIADVFERQGKYDESLRSYQWIITCYNKEFGENHLRTLRAVRKMAEVLSGQCEYKKAIELLEPALTSAEASFGKNHSETLDIVSSLADALHGQGKYNDAMELYEWVRSGITIDHSEDPVQTFCVVRCIADIFRQQEKWDEAMQQYELVYAASVKAFGKDNETVLPLLKILADISCRQGEYNKGKQWLEQALVHSQRIHGKNQATTLAIVDQLAHITDILQLLTSYDECKRLVALTDACRKRDGCCRDRPDDAL